MLFQARFKDVPQGAYGLSAVMNKQVYEVPPSGISAVELESRTSELEALVATANSTMQVDATRALTLGLRTPARLVGVNGTAIASKESARVLGNVPDNESVQAVILTSTELASMPMEEFLEKKVASIAKKKNENYVGSMTARS